MRVALGAVANLSLGDVASPYACISQEETLVGSESVDNGQRMILSGVFEGCIGYLQTTVVGQVLTQRQATIGIKVGQHLDSREEIGILVGAGLELLAIGSSPPVVHITILVELASLVVEAVGHLVTNHHADGTIVEGIVGRHIKEGHLQNTGREADLVGGGVIVGIHGLRIHIPVVDIHGLASHVVNLVLVPELTTCQQVLVVRL